MHDGCAGSFNSGIEVLNKVRMMGFAEQYVPAPLMVTCGDCGDEFTMDTFEAKCPKCGMIHAVTPCHAFDAANVQAAGKDL